jgi:predicted transposase YdaD
MTRYKLRGHEREPLTAAEEIAEDKRQAEQAIMRQAEKVAEDARQANRASTKSKLQALGLTVDEIKDTFNI